MNPMARDILRQSVAQRYVWQGQGEGMELTDDYNPIDVLDLPLKEKLRKRIIEMTPVEILLSVADHGAGWRAA